MNLSICLISNFTKRWISLILSFTLIFICLTAAPSSAHNVKRSLLKPAPARPQSSAPTMGAWSPLLNWGLINGQEGLAIHTHLLPDGRVLFWNFNTGGIFIWNYDPAINDASAQPFPVAAPTPIQRLAPAQPTNLFCAGHSFLPDGRLLVTGGSVTPGQANVGVAYTNIFNYANSTWTTGPDMSATLVSDAGNPKEWGDLCDVRANHSRH